MKINATLVNGLSIGFWNIDGLHYRIGNSRQSKLSESTVINKLTKYDLICLVETHCSPSDLVYLEGYSVVSNTRPKSKNAKKFTGGISILVKQEIRKGIKFIEATHSEYLWLKLDKAFFNLDEDIYVATVYISPSHSNFSNRQDDIFSLVKEDIAMYSRLGNCTVLGDFNGRTNTEPDFCADDNIDDLVDIPFHYVQDIALPRMNQDLSPVDSHGSKLLGLCKSTGLRIVNGRFLGDTSGCYTCYSYVGKPSAIDYALVSDNLMKSIKLFHVEDPNLYSIYCPLSLVLKTRSFKTNSPQELSPCGTTTKYVWSKGDDVKLQNSLRNSHITDKLNEFINRGVALNTESINSATTCLTNILSSAADHAGIKMRKPKHPARKSKKKVVKKKWFTNDCMILKSRLERLGKSLRQDPYNYTLVSEYRHLRKQYKKCIKTSRQKYVDNIWSNLESLQSRDPKAFWKLFDELKELDTVRKSNPISMDTWRSHFYALLNRHFKPNPNVETNIDNFLANNKNVFNSLNYKITQKEISESISDLKSKKAPGADGILNEMLKTAHPFITKQLELLFNAIFTSSVFPDIWRIQILNPLHKKGDIYQPENYRGIAIGSCLSKLFLSILHGRLVKFADTNKLIPIHQIGYRKGSRTTDHILTLKSIIDKFINQLPRRYLFACFVDFKSAFDTVWRKALFFKLLKYDIGGNFLSIIQNMYSDVQYRVKIDNLLSPPIESCVGVKQGCVLSPLLFNLYLSDFPQIFDDSCDPVSINQFKLNCLMFADDVVLLSETASGLQNCINQMSNYCSMWQLSVNISKTKVVIFNKGGHRISRFTFSLHDETIEIAQSYTYLGIVFASSGSFKQACNALTDKAKKAFFKLRMLNPHKNAILTIKLFQMLIMPIVTYGSEVWGPFMGKKISWIIQLEICLWLPSIWDHQYEIM